MGRFTPEGQEPAWLIIVIILITTAAAVIAVVLCKGWLH